jgi:putative RNA 2'-phosphotransferase
MKDLDSKQLVQISKMIAKTLRHKPESLGLALERGGWIAVDTLLAAFARKGYSLSRGELERLMIRASASAPIRVTASKLTSS